MATQVLRWLLFPHERPDGRFITHKFNVGRSPEKVLAKRKALLSMSGTNVDVVMRIRGLAAANFEAMFICLKRSVVLECFLKTLLPETIAARGTQCAKERAASPTRASRGTRTEIRRRLSRVLCPRATLSELSGHEWNSEESLWLMSQFELCADVAVTENSTRHPSVMRRSAQLLITTSADTSVPWIKCPHRHLSQWLTTPEASFRLEPRGQVS